MTMPRLQVLICTYGPDGIRRLAAHNHPPVSGVEYVVGWQLPDGDCDVPESLASRCDFRIIKHRSVGSGLNRDVLLQMASSPLVLMSDDDLDYLETDLMTVIDSFDSHPEADFITFRYRSPLHPREYPDYSFNMRRQPKGYYVATFEMAFRLGSIRSVGLRFNRHFGVNSTFPSGEDTLFMMDALRRRLNGIYIPADICTHEGDTTGMRHASEPRIIATKGALIAYDFPATWILRMIAHALRQKDMSALAYMRHWIGGVRRSRRLKVFR